MLLFPLRKSILFWKPLCFWEEQNLTEGSTFAGQVSPANVAPGGHPLMFALPCGGDLLWFGNHISLSSFVLLFLLVFNIILSLHSSFIFFWHLCHVIDKQLRSPWFYFWWCYPHGAQLADCISELFPAFPLPNMLTAPLCSSRTAYHCWWVFDGLFPECLSPFWSQFFAFPCWMLSHGDVLADLLTGSDGSMEAMDFLVGTAE